MMHRNVPRAVCALGTVHVLLRHAPLSVSCVPCGCMEDSDRVVEFIFWQLYVLPLLRPYFCSENKSEFFMLEQNIRRHLLVS